MKMKKRYLKKRYAQENSVDYEDINVIVAHLGGGISVGAHKKEK